MFPPRCFLTNDQRRGLLQYLNIWQDLTPSFILKRSKGAFKMMKSLYALKHVISFTWLILQIVEQTKHGELANSDTQTSLVKDVKVNIIVAEK